MSYIIIQSIYKYDQIITDYILTCNTEEEAVVCVSTLQSIEKKSKECISNEYYVQYIKDREKGLPKAPSPKLTFRTFCALPSTPSDHTGMKNEYEKYSSSWDKAVLPSQTAFEKYKEKLHIEAVNFCKNKNLEKFCSSLTEDENNLRLSINFEIIPFNIEFYYKKINNFSNMF